jgi:hypothetical protein
LFTLQSQIHILLYITNKDLLKIKRPRVAESGKPALFIRWGGDGVVWCHVLIEIASYETTATIPPLKKVYILFTCIYHRQLLISDTFYAFLMWSLFTVLTVYSERKQSEQNI